MQKIRGGAACNHPRGDGNGNARHANLIPYRHGQGYKDIPLPATDSPSSEEKNESHTQPSHCSQVQPPASKGAEVPRRRSCLIPTRPPTLRPEAHGEILAPRALHIHAGGVEDRVDRVPAARQSPSRAPTTCANLKRERLDRIQYRHWRSAFPRAAGSLIWAASNEFRNHADFLETAQVSANNTMKNCNETKRSNILASSEM